MDLYLDASAAARLLGVSRQTLYAYVSRGLIRSEPGKNSRERKYNRLDLETLNGGKRIRTEPQAELSRALHWGAPLLDSALTLISDGRLYYRGVEVNELAAGRSFWEVAQWFWSNSWDYEAPPQSSRENLNRESPFVAIQNDLMSASENDPLGYDYTLPGLVETGGKILQLFLQRLSSHPEGDVSMAGQVLQRSWCGAYREAGRLLNAALILCIDHELNASSFTARVTVGAGCNLYEVVSAAFCALHGARHGGQVLRAALLLDELYGTKTPREYVLQQAQTGIEIPGFGHRLYPKGDPRAAFLFKLLGELYPDRMTRLGDAVLEMASLLKKAPTLDLALAVLTKVLELPAESGFYLFALGRAVGWIGHAAEQKATDQLIRPRARYVGVLP